MQLMGYGDQAMTGSPARRSRLMAEAVTAGLAYAMLLWWLSVCALGSFRPELLPFPYWPQLSGLRSDTSGALAFVVAAICLVASEYLRLRRRAASRPGVASRRLVNRPAALFTVAVAETVAVLGTGLVVYISTNAITHPETLLIGTTHLAPWPTEGTLRMLALFGCAASVAVLRYLLAGVPLRRSGRQPAPAAPSGREPSGGDFPAVLPVNGNGTAVSPAAGHPAGEE
jgi:hypothetical protein